jgi:exodeoxyribonuclease-3
MKIITWNINGLRSILKKGLPDFISSKKPDLLCLQEIKIDPIVLEKENIEFKNYITDYSCAERKGYSGVATLIKTTHTQATPALRGIGKKEFDSEGRFLIHRFPELTVCNSYFPSGTSGEERQDFKYSFLDNLFTHLKKLSSKEREKMIICGDFNICHKDVDIHHPREAEKRMLSGFLPDERKWMDKFADLGFTDSYRHLNPKKTGEYSWWTFRANAREKNLGWRIDYIFVGSGLVKKIKSAKILTDVYGSDHCPVEIIMDI